MTQFLLLILRTFDTFRKCVEDYIQRKTHQRRRVEQLCFKRKRGKNAVRLDGDGDISAFKGRTISCGYR